MIEKASVLLFTARDAARALAISQRTLWGLTKDGQIACVRINGWTVRYDPDDLKAWMQRQKDKPAPPARNKKTAKSDPGIA